MSDSPVIIEKKDRICTLTLNRPETMNAINHDLVTSLREATVDLVADETIRVVVLQGAGGNFCSGADFSLFTEGLSASFWLAGMQKLGKIIQALREMPQPLICKVQGAAIGGGCNLALAGDMVIAAHDARFAENFVNIGLVLDAGGTYFLPRLVGLVKARELAFLGDVIDGRTAADIGLIHKSTADDELDREVRNLAESLSRKSLAAMSLIKHGLENSFDQNLKNTLDLESANQTAMLVSDEHKEAVRNFMASRNRT